MKENKWIKECIDFFDSKRKGYCERNVKFRLIKDTKKYTIYDWVNSDSRNKWDYRAIAIKEKEKIYCWGLTKNKRVINGIYVRDAYKVEESIAWEEVGKNCLGNIRNPDEIINALRVMLL
jgi:hypothetical protein